MEQLTANVLIVLIGALIMRAIIGTDDDDDFDLPSRGRTA